MSQLSKGTTYSTGDQVTAVNLNNLVDEAILLPGAISDQLGASSVSASDTLLINQSGALKRASALQIASTRDLTNYLTKGGGTLTGPLLLYGPPGASSEAATKGYVDAQDASVSAASIAGIALCVAKAGDAMSGPLALSADPTSGMQAATKQYVDSVSAGSLPVGAIMAFFRSSAPPGWLQCNGQSTSGFSALAALIGANVPDLRGEFIRGWDNGRGVDSGRVLGSSQNDMLEAHTHTVGVADDSSTSGSKVKEGTGNVDTSVTTSSSGGTETRPRNIALMYCIKT
jgi:microcystin-dependent protein